MIAFVTPLLGSRERSGDDRMARPAIQLRAPGTWFRCAGFRSRQALSRDWIVAIGIVCSVAGRMTKALAGDLLAFRT